MTIIFYFSTVLGDKVFCYLSWLILDIIQIHMLNTTNFPFSDKRISRYPRAQCNSKTLEVEPSVVGVQVFNFLR